MLKITNVLLVHKNIHLIFRGSTFYSFKVSNYSDNKSVGRGRGMKVRSFGHH